MTKEMSYGFKNWEKIFGGKSKAKAEKSGRTPAKKTAKRTGKARKAGK